MNRRHFVRHGLTAASSALLGSCTSIDRAVPRHAGKGRLLRVDAHCHIFNGEDIDGLGYAFQMADPANKKNVLAKPLAALAKSLIALVKWRAPGKDAETRLLDNLLDRRAERIRKNLQPTDRRALLALLEEDVLDLNSLSWRQSFNFRKPDGSFPDHRSKQDEVTRQVEAALRNPRSDAGAALQAVQEQLSKPEVLAQVRDTSRHPFGWLLHPILAGKFHGGEDWIGGFIKSFVAHRIINAVHLMRRYPDIDLFVAATLDVDQWFLGGFHGRPGNPSEPMQAQVEIAGKIAVLTEGRVIPRTGFDPLRQAYWDYQKQSGRQNLGASPAETLENACEQWGSVGAKLYPVVGFRPWNNMGLGNLPALQNCDFNKIVRAFLKDTGKHLTDGGYEISRALDAALSRLYTKCNHGEYTVMAHTNHSHGGSPEAEDRTAPYFFGAASKDFPNVRFDLGHFGGLDSSKVEFASAEPMDPNAQDEHPRWPEIIARYFSNDSRGIYADISFVRSSPDRMPLKNLIHFLECYPASRSKMLYGSDWHELLSSLTSYSYYHKWTREFESNPRLRPYAEGVLGQNAADFVGLRAHEKTRLRLDKFFDSWKVNRSVGSKKIRPEWVSLVDAGRTRA